MSAANLRLERVRDLKFRDVILVAFLCTDDRPRAAAVLSEAVLRREELTTWSPVESVRPGVTGRLDVRAGISTLCLKPEWFVIVEVQR